MADLKPHEFAGTDRYRVQRRIGEGGMGVVYEVYDRKRAATVALKTLLRLSPGAIYRFKREFRALADVSHPNLVTLHELVSEGDTWFYTMELVEGVGFLEYVRPGSDAVDPKTAPTAALVDAASKTKSLDITIDPADITVDDSTQALLGQEPPPLHIDRLRHALTRLAEGLVALHDAGKLHRDLKPSNVMIAQERVVILDFGLATDIDEDSLDKSRMESMVGTVAYMPPEQAGGAPSSKAGDWYSVGVMLFRALTGRLPFTGTLYQVVYDKQQREPPLASELQSELPRDLVQLAADLLRTDPKPRPIGREILERLGGRVPHLATPAYARPALDRLVDGISRALRRRSDDEVKA
ncbi:MAG: serine/threonine-protein kinase, partial [Deltaproteobacteria bacterium]